MKNETLKYLIIALVILTLIKFFWNGLTLDWISFSDSIESSKKSKMFISEYKIDELTFFDNISEELIDSLDIQNGVFWSEKEFSREPFLVFFHPRQETGKNVLILKVNSKNHEKTLRFKTGSKHAKVRPGLAVIEKENNEISKVTLDFSFLGKELGKLKLSPLGPLLRNTKQNAH